MQHNIFSCIFLASHYICKMAAMTGCYENFNNILNSQPILIKFALKLFVCKCLSFQTHLLLDVRFSLTTRNIIMTVYKITKTIVQKAWNRNEIKICYTFNCKGDNLRVTKCLAFNFFKLWIEDILFKQSMVDDEQMMEQCK